MHKKCSDIRGRVKQDDEFKCWICASQGTDRGLFRNVIKWCTSWSCEEVLLSWWFNGGGRGADDTVLVRTRNGWTRFRDLFIFSRLNININMITCFKYEDEKLLNFLFWKLIVRKTYLHSTSLVSLFHANITVYAVKTAKKSTWDIFAILF